MNKKTLRSRYKGVTGINGLVDFGLLMVLIFFGVFGGWAVSVPLSSAVVATGKVIKQGRTQEVAHEQGGVIAEIKVREGQTVRKGDVLVVLDDVEQRSQRNRFGAKLAGLKILDARLEAEQRGLDEFVIDRDQLGLVDGSGDDMIGLAAMIADQQKEFATRRTAQQNERAVLAAQISAMQEELAGIEGEFKALQIQIASLDKETKLRRDISKQGYGRDSELRRYERELAGLQGDKVRLETRKHALPHKIAEVSKRLEMLDGEFQKAISQEIADVRRQIVDFENQFAAADNSVRRVEVLAPSNGVIDVMHVNTVGSAVAAFTPIAEIVPERASVLVEVELNPADVDVVQIDQNARIVLSAFDPNEVLPVDAKTVFISPDQRVRERDGSSYFVARLSIDPKAIATLPPIKTGMPVEAYLTTGQRTFAQMLLEPFTESMRRSFKG